MMNMHALSPLLMTHIMWFLPTVYHHSLISCAGSLGYHSLKEMLQNGIPGHTLLIESCDLRDVVDVVDGGGNGNDSLLPCSLLFTHRNQESTYDDRIPRHSTHITIFTNMECIPHNFLGDCLQLTHVEFSSTSFQQVELLQYCFLQSCGYLRAIDLTPLSKVTTIQGSFLEGCGSLTEIDLSPLSQVTEIQHCFLIACSGLTALDMRPLSKVATIQHSFLSRCYGLKNLKLFSPESSNIKEVEYLFLDECTGLTSIDLSCLSHLSEIQHSFLKRCSGLKSINLTPLSQISEIQGPFLEGCSCLKSIDLSQFANLSEVPDGLLQEHGTRATVLLPPHLASQNAQYSLPSQSENDTSQHYDSQTIPSPPVDPGYDNMCSSTPHSNHHQYQASNSADLYRHHSSSSVPSQPSTLRHTTEISSDSLEEGSDSDNFTNQEFSDEDSSFHSCRSPSY